MFSPVLSIDSLKASILQQMAILLSKEEEEEEEGEEKGEGEEEEKEEGVKQFGCRHHEDTQHSSWKWTRKTHTTSLVSGYHIFKGTRRDQSSMHLYCDHIVITTTSPLSLVQ